MHPRYKINTEKTVEKVHQRLSQCEQGGENQVVLKQVSDSDKAVEGAVRNYAKHEPQNRGHGL